MHDKKGTYIAFFDLDGTILDTSSGLLFVRYMKDRKLIHARDRVRFIYAMLLYKLRLIDANGAMEILARRFTGASLEETLRHNDDLFRDYIKQRIRREAVEEIGEHHKRGGMTVMLSASTNYICDRVVKYLGMSDMLCTELEVQGGELTGRLSRPYCHGREKLKRAREFCSQKGHDLSSSYYYGDSYADSHVMEVVAHPRCVRPDRKLRTLAARRGWTIHDWS
ncbi:MAG: HAD-IB family hydrolase [Spirochaetae bacterium HGW-Spirochaetae-1]|jgi:HAD superfamily hydrolase (TIGR01490 family)|nr:MAG: HAD-IB family hydrolase [Spirochaetae bacterium HGW-Spirochaetae-1]